MEKRQLINYRQVEICRNEQIVLQKPILNCSVESLST